MIKQENYNDYVLGKIELDMNLINFENKNLDKESKDKICENNREKAKQRLIDKGILTPESVKENKIVDEIDDISEDSFRENFDMSYGYIDNLKAYEIDYEKVNTLNDIINILKNSNKLVYYANGAEPTEDFKKYLKV